MIITYPNKLILSIEDDPVYSQFLEKIAVNLLKSKFKHFYDPTGALEWLADGNKPDLILLDMEMPVMDGLTALKTLRMTLGLKEMKVIPCTSLASPELLKSLLKLGISDYIQKRATTKQVIDKIATALND